LTAIPNFGKKCAKCVVEPENYVLQVDTLRLRKDGGGSSCAEACSDEGAGSEFWYDPQRVVR